MFDAATQDEYRQFPARRSLNPERHRSDRLTHFAVAAVPN
jgi:hypothetical protein